MLSYNIQKWLLRLTFLYPTRYLHLKPPDSTWTKEDKDDIPIPDGTPFPSMGNIRVTKQRVVTLLLKLNPAKACGPDLLSAMILKKLAHVIVSYLTIVFQKSLDTGRVPKNWRSANVTAIFKKGKKYQSSNYRPVSLTCICCKIQEHILTSSILKQLDEYDILTDCQHGFRARRSCETQRLTLADELVSGLGKRQQHDLIVLDFSKAFDLVPHERLLRKMDHYDLRGSTLEWIRAFPTDRVQQVTVEWPHQIASKYSAEYHRVQSWNLYFFSLTTAFFTEASKTRKFL